MLGLEWAYVHANVLFGNEKLGAQVILCHQLIVHDGERANAGENKILRNLIGKGFHTKK